MVHKAAARAGKAQVLSVTSKCRRATEYANWGNWCVSATDAEGRDVAEPPFAGTFSRALKFASWPFP